MDDRFVHRSEIEVDGSLIGKVTFKPYMQILTLAIGGVAMMLLKNRICIIVGIAMILVSLIGLIMIKDYSVLEFYTDCLLVFDKNDSNMVRKIEYFDIKTWGVDVSNHRVGIRLQNDEMVMTETMRYMKAFNLFNKLLKEKSETSQLKSLSDRFFK